MQHDPRTNDHGLLSGRATAMAGPDAPRVAMPSRLPHPVRGVLFDICNVLYDNTVWRRWVWRLLSRLGVYTSYRCFFRLWEREYLDDVHRGRRGFCEAFESLLRSIGLSPGQIDEIEAACQARRRQLEASARPLPGVKSTLGQLHRAGYVLGAISNSEYTASVLAQRLARFGLDRSFTAIVSSTDLGRTMPDRICYATAVQAMGLPIEQVAFVDHDAIELAGAAAVGMATVAFNYDPDAQADVYLARFEELLEVVSVPRPLAAAG